MEEKIPQLTLTPDLEEVKPEVKQETALVQEAAPAAGPDLSILSPAEQQAVKSFAKQIDISNSQQVLQYGAAAQKNIADFSESALDSVRTKDMGQIGDMLTDLVAELKSIDTPEQKKGFAGLFQRANNSVEKMKLQYSKAETNVDRISEALEKHQITLMKDIAVLDQMYDKNLEYYKQLTMYILAGREKLAEEQNGTLAELRRKAQESGKTEDAQAANDYANLIDRFEKKLHDLELTRMVSLQMGPQIRMLQNNDTLMTEKIQSSLVNTIPLWKSQMVLNLGIHHSQQAMEAQRQVTDMTNQLLRSNADMLKMATVETAKEAERSVVDIETLKHTNESLISTLDEVLQIQTEGRQKRQQAEVEMRRIEGELKQKLLELRG
ncbi:MAG: toxic anion resistance protein [Candidatus Avoscillospira sp.]